MLHYADKMPKNVAHLDWKPLDGALTDHRGEGTLQEDATILVAWYDTTLHWWQFDTFQVTFDCDGVKMFRWDGTKIDGLLEWTGQLYTVLTKL